MQLSTHLKLTGPPLSPLQASATLAFLGCRSTPAQKWPPKLSASVLCGLKQSSSLALDDVHVCPCMCRVTQ